MHHLLWGGQIALTSNYEQPGDLYGNHPRMPAAPIYVNQDGHLFTFQSSLAGETVEIVADDTLLYSTIIGTDASVTIPADISGEVELRLIRGSMTYRATIEL